jgi:molybdopterin-guanine dinucleotide biosynthesis protein A
LSKFDVIIPAGGKLDEEFARVVATDSKALIRFDGDSILNRTLTAFKECGQVGRIALVGSHSVLESREAARADLTLREADSAPQNIYRGLEALTESGEAPERVLICTCDLPFITADVVTRFLVQAPDGFDFVVPLVAKAEFNEMFPGAPGTFVTLQDGVWTTGCLFMASAFGLKRSVHQIESVFLRRKSKLGMARLLGFGFVYRLLTKKLTVKDVERKVGELIGVRGAAVKYSPAELAYDVDYVEDYHYALQTFRARTITPVLR